MGGFSAGGQEVWRENLRKMVSMAKSLATLGSGRVWVGAALGCSGYMVGPRVGLGAGCPWWPLEAHPEAQGRFSFR